MAVPEGMLSVHMSHALTLLVTPSAFSAVMAPMMAAAPAMSIFMSRCMESLGLREMPPASYMIPLPSRAMCDVGVPSGV